MKKLAFFSILALGLAAVSCEDYDFPNPPAQSNEQLPVLDAAGVVIAAPSDGQTVNLGQINDADKLVTLGQVDAYGDFDASLFDLDFTAQVAASEDFSNPVAVKCQTTGNTVAASPDDLDAAFHTIFATIAPDAKTAHIRLKAYAQRKSDNTRYLLGGEKSFYGVQKVSMIPFDPGFVVEEKYYLIGTCTNGTIDASKAIQLHNSGNSPYDDPNFSVVVNITADEAQAGYNWAVVPESTLAAGTGNVMVPAAEFVGESASGDLVNASAPGAWNTIYEADKHLIMVNVRPSDAGTYSFSWILALDYLYTPGGGNNWTPSAAPALYTNDYINYCGYSYLNGEFKLSKAPDWDHGDFGYGGSEGTLGNGGSNIPGPDPAGLYWITANISALTYTLTNVTTYGIIGDATVGGWDASTPMTPSENLLTWTITTELKAGEFKFRANDDWALNQGGMGEGGTPMEPTLELKQDGSNIKVTEAGTYDIVLDLTKLPYSCTITKK